MRFRTPFIIAFQAVTVVIALAVVAVLVRPGLFTETQRVVEFIESAAPLSGITAQVGPVSYADAVAIAAPSVVNIYTRKTVSERGHPFLDDPLFRRFFGEEPGDPRERTETSLGSGVVISAGGYILTNNHVIAEADQIEVAFHDGHTADAEVVGGDPESDLAVLKVKTENLPTVTLGHSDTLRVGDVVLAIGNPYGVGQTVTQGIVSAVGRDQLGISTFENFIQTDAAINPGNSGGALINTRGELVGINTAIFSRTGGSQGIGFAIPVSIARGVMKSIIENGRVVRGWLGVEVQDITAALAESFELADHNGVIVAGVLPGGPAEKAGLEPGDVITAINGQPIRNVTDALTNISRAGPGDELEVTGRRGDQPLKIIAKVGERPAQP